MKLYRFLIATLLFLCVFLQYVVAEDSSQWSLPENAVARIGKGQITDMAYSPDGKLLAVGTSIGAWLYDTHTGKELALFAGYKFSRIVEFRDNLNRIIYYNTSIAFSPDGKTLATACWDDNIRFWDVQTHEIKATLEVQGGVKTVLFSPDGRTFISAGSLIQLWDANSLQHKFTFKENYEYITSLAVSPDGTTLASASDDERIDLWDMQKGEHLTKIHGRTRSDKVLAFSPDGTILACRGPNETIRLWNTKTRKRLKLLIGHYRTVVSVGFSPDGKTLASGSWDRTIMLWDVQTGKHKATLTGHKGEVNTLVYSPDGKTLATGSSDGTIRFWNTQANQHKNTLIHSHSWSQMALSSDGKTFITSESKDILLWNIHTRQLKTRLTSDLHFRYYILSSQSGSTIANAGYGNRDKEFPQFPYGNKDKQFLLWNVHTGERREPFIEQHKDVFSDTRSRMLSPDGTILAVGKEDGTVQLWNTHTGENKATFTKHNKYISALVFSPDGKLLATGDEQQTIHLWDTVSAEHIISYTTGFGTIGSLAFSPDNKVLASATQFEIRLWNLETGEYTATYKRLSTTSLAFSPDGKMLASGYRDAKIRLWDTRTGHLYDTLIGHFGGITSLAFLQPNDMSKTTYSKKDIATQNQYIIASLSEDKTVYLWKVKPVVDTNTVVKLTPHLVESPAVGEQLTFNIDIKGAKNITGFHTTIDFDNTVLRYVSSKNGDYLTGEISAEVTHIYPNRVKLVSTASSKIGHGDVTLASVTFKVIDQKALYLSLSKVRLEKSDGSLARPTVIGSTVYDPQQNMQPIEDYTQFALPEGATTRLGKGRVNAMEFSPDNTQLVVATSIGIWIYDANTGDEIALIKENAANESVIAFSPYGDLFASSQFHGNINLWNSYTYQPVDTFADEGREGNGDLMFFSDGCTLSNGKKIWNIHTGQLIGTIISGNVDTISQSDMSPDGKTIATTTKENKIQLWDAHNGKELVLLNKERNDSRQHKILFSPDGTKLAAIGSAQNRPNSTILLWDADTHELISTYTERDNAKVFLSIDFSQEGDLITVVKDWHRTLRLRNYETGEELAVFGEHDGRVDVVTFSPDKTTLASVDSNGAIRLWDIESGELLMKLKGGVHVPASVALSPDGSTLAMPNSTGGLDFWDRYKNRIVTFPLKTDVDEFWEPNTYAHSPNWRIIAAGAWRTIRLWDTTTEKYVATLTTDDNSFEIGNIIYSPDGRTLAANEMHGYEIILWNTHTQEQIATLKGHTDKIHAITFSPDGALLASCSGQWDEDDNTIRLWDTKTGKERSKITNIVIEKLRKRSRAVTAIAFSPDGKTIASTDASCDVKLWDVDTKKQKAKLVASSGQSNSYYQVTHALAFSPDGTMLTSTGLSTAINVWDVEAEKLQSILKGHTGIVTNLEYSEDGTTLMSRSNDGTALFWEMRQTPVTRLQITPRSVQSPPAGKQLNFDIYMVDGQDVSGYQFMLEYDAKALRVIPDNENTNIRNIDISPPVVKKNTIAFTGSASSGATIKDGPIASITFEVIERADVTLTIKEAHLTHNDGERSLPAIGRAWVFEPQRMPEDVNLDWQLDDADLEFVSTRLGQKGKDNPADVNKDGIVDIADLVLIRNALYGLEPESETE